MPAEVLLTGRTITAYRVPAVTASGLAKFAVKKPPAPLLKPVMVAVARSGPVGTAGLPAVARIETVRLGVVPAHPLQNRSRSARVSCPLTAAVKVWPAQPVELKAKPL